MVEIAVVRFLRESEQWSLSVQVVLMGPLRAPSLHWIPDAVQIPIHAQLVQGLPMIVVFGEASAGEFACL